MSEIQENGEVYAIALASRMGAVKTEVQTRTYGDPLPKDDVLAFKRSVTGVLDESWEHFDHRIHDHGFGALANTLYRHYLLPLDVSGENPQLLEVTLSRQKAGDSTLYDQVTLISHKPSSVGSSGRFISPGETLLDIELWMAGSETIPTVMSKTNSDVDWYRFEAMCTQQGIRMADVNKLKSTLPPKTAQALENARNVFNRQLSEKDRPNYETIKRILQEGTIVETSSHLEALKETTFSQSPTNQRPQEVTRSISPIAPEPQQSPKIPQPVRHEHLPPPPPRKETHATPPASRPKGRSDNPSELNPELRKALERLQEHSGWRVTETKPKK